MQNDLETNNPGCGQVDYPAILEQVKSEESEEIAAALLHELPLVWSRAYQEMTPRPTDICVFSVGTFEYIFDDYATLVATGQAPNEPDSEARLVAALGRSRPAKRSRDDARLRGWVGPTERYFGKAWDKGHFMAHTIGGAVEGIEANVFVQRRDLNRGWSAPGKRFRAMEKYCFSNPDTFCFNRPLYTDGSAKPSFFEFGVLKGSKELWIECFDNR